MSARLTVTDRGTLPLGECHVATVPASRLRAKRLRVSLAALPSGRGLLRSSACTQHVAVYALDDLRRLGESATAIGLTWLPAADRIGDFRLVSVAEFFGEKKTVPQQDVGASHGARSVAGEVVP